ncbi:hypothetical protein KSP40_PGU014736 [Platanthera guangdongensis]|uniref:Starch synthase catalytic domain-containing protein n=1 Tax=Platanthera guangdongensis TaxID=2320717 RepID=A0ABR2MWQ1_9ASPA
MDTLHPIFSAQVSAAVSPLGPSAPRLSAAGFTPPDTAESSFFGGIRLLVARITPAELIVSRDLLAICLFSDDSHGLLLSCGLLFSLLAAAGSCSLADFSYRDLLLPRGFLVARSCHPLSVRNILSHSVLTTSVRRDLSSVRCSIRCSNRRGLVEAVTVTNVVTAIEFKEEKSGIEEMLHTVLQHIIVFVTSEAAPYSKTGGLADVCGSLPIALAARGHRVMVVSPRYLNGISDINYATAFDTGVRIKAHCFGGQQEVGFFHEYRAGVDWVFVDHPSYHRPGNPYGDENGAFGDNQFRFTLLCHAACEAPLVLPLGGYTYGQNCLFLVNDWHAGLVPMYVFTRNPNTRNLALAIHLFLHVLLSPSAHLPHGRSSSSVRTSLQPLQLFRRTPAVTLFRVKSIRSRVCAVRTARASLFLAISIGIVPGTPTTMFRANSILSGVRIRSPAQNYGWLRLIGADRGGHKGLLASKYRPHGIYKDARSILVIHNLAHQGVEPAATYDNLGLPPNWYGAVEWVFPTWARTHALDKGETVNIMKGAIVSVDRIVTVSQRSRDLRWLVAARRKGTLYEGWNQSAGDGIGLDPGLLSGSGWKSATGRGKITKTMA